MKHGIACTAALLLAAGIAWSDEPQASDESTLWERDGLLGSWDGGRSHLRKQGVDLELVYTVDGFTNVSGGQDIGGTMQSLAALGLDLDLEPLVGWSGGFMHASGFWLEGENLADEHVSALTAVTSIEGVDEVRLFEAWLEQSAFDGTASLRIGFLAADEEFMVSEIALLFINSTFGPPTGVTASAPLPIYPVAAPGARLRVDPTDRLFVQLGIYDGDPGSEEFNDTGARIRMDHEQGASILLEAGVESPLDAPGSFKVGVLVHRGEFEEFGTGRIRRGNSGTWAVLEQTLFRESEEDDEQGLDTFLRITILPDDTRSVVPAYVDGGIQYVGLIPTRDEDAFGIGFAVMNVSREYADTQARPSTYDRETVLEATYRIALSPWLSVQPDVQVIVHPEGTSRNEDAVVIGFRAEITF